MTIGKREQIVFGVITAIILVALLHVTLFAPQQEALTRKKQAYDDTFQKVNIMQKAANPKDLQKYTSDTQKLINQLNVGVGGIASLKTPDEFIYPDLDPAKDPNGLAKLIWKTIEQTTLVLKQVDALAKFTPSTKSNMVFLKQLWGLPAALPPSLDAATLNDAVVGLKNSLEMLGNAKGALKDQTQAAYKQGLLQIGMNTDAADRLKVFGEFVPLMYQFQILNLIMERLTTGKSDADLKNLMIRLDTQKARQFRNDQVPSLLAVGAKYDAAAITRISIRTGLMEILGIDPPIQPIDTEPKDGVVETRFYFMYYELYFLNRLLALAETQNVVEIDDITLWSYSYLRKAPKDKPLPELASTVVLTSLTDDRRMDYDYGSKKNAQMSLFDMLTADQIAIMENQKGIPEADIRALDSSQYSEFFPDGAASPGGGITAGVKPGAVAAAPSAPQQKKDAKPQDDDIGYAFPIEITFQATNKDGWSFIYSVLNQSPLNQIYRFDIESGSATRTDALSNNYKFSVEFLFVSKLRTLDQVTQMLQQLEHAPGSATPAPVAAAPGAPGAPAPAAAAKATPTPAAAAPAPAK